MTHESCVLDTDPSMAEAVAAVRGWRLVLAQLNDDENAISVVLDETGDCVQCLRCMIRFTTALCAGTAQGVYGQDVAVRTVERELSKAIATRDEPKSC